MGQRSQIYISFIKDNKKDNKPTLIAKYYQWNYGSRMVSRAHGLIEWIEANKNYLNFCSDMIGKIADVNFDLREIQDGYDLIEEAKSCEYDIIRNADNNNGRLFIQVSEDNTIKYAFTKGYDDFKPMTAEEYMTAGEYDDDPYPTEEDRGSNYTANAEYFKQYQLMTEDEVKYFADREYTNYYAADYKKNEEE